MSITIPIDLGYELDVNSPVKEVFAVLANVPDSASHYPKVAKLIALGDGVYRWEMEPIGIGSVHLQTMYTSRYTANKTKGEVRWEPVPDGGNAEVSGSWTITPLSKQSAKLVLQVHAELTLALPALTKVVMAPLVEIEFEQMTERYIENLIARFGGEV